MMQSEIANLPFRIDRGSTLDLTDQIEKGLAGAIHSGTYSPGDRLPGIREMARELGVSNVVVSRAVQRLNEMGQVESRRRAGIRVSPTDRPVAHGHVLLVDSLGASYYFGARAQSMIMTLQAANMRVTPFHYLQDDATCGRLEMALDSLSVSLVLLAVVAPELAAICAARGLPYVAMNADSSTDSQSAATVRHQSQRALGEFADHLRSLNVTRIHAITPHLQQLAPVHAALAAVGLEMTVDPSVDWDARHGSEGYEYAGFKATQRLLASGTLPELLYVPDDFIARGCITALLLAGKRLPLDVQLVAHLNRGAHPAYTGPITRMENDPIAHGRALAQAILHVRDSDPAATPRAFTLESTFIPGSTTCPLPAATA